MSIFVAQRIEKAQKEKNESALEELRKAVNINVFDALFKTIIPAEIFEVVKAEIIENKAIRKKAYWIFEFKEESSGLIKLTATTHYELHNVSKLALEEPIKIEIDPLSANDEKVVKAQCVASNGKVLVEYDPGNDKKNNINFATGPNGHQRISYTVSIPPSDYIVSTLERTAEYKGVVFDLQNTRYPIIDLTIQAAFPSGYKFTVHPMLSSELKIISIGATQQTYKVEGGILPRQGILYTLEKIS